MCRAAAAVAILVLAACSSSAPTEEVTTSSSATTTTAATTTSAQESTTTTSQAGAEPGDYPLSPEYPLWFYERRVWIDGVEVLLVPVQAGQSPDEAEQAVVARYHGALWDDYSIRSWGTAWLAGSLAPGCCGADVNVDRLWRVAGVGQSVVSFRRSIETMDGAWPTIWRSS